MNKKILTAAIALSVAATSAFAQTKQLSAPTKTEPTTVTQTTSTPKPTTPVKTTPQAVTPPDAVATKFKTMYPEVQGVKWMQNKQTNYVAVFKSKVNECRTVFNADGSVVREIMVMQQSALPAPVSAYLTKNFAGKTPKRCEQSKNEKGKIIYIIKYDDKLIRLDSEGNEVKQVEEMEKSE